MVDNENLSFHFSSPKVDTTKDNTGNFDDIEESYQKAYFSNNAF